MEDVNITDEEIKEAEAEAAFEYAELHAREGLEHIAAFGAPGPEAGHDKFSRLAEEYNWVVGVAPFAVSPHLHFGKLFVICGMYPQAVVALARAVKLKPDDSDAHCLYARSLAMTDKLEEALTEYTTACQLDPRLLEARFEREIVQIRIEENERRVETARRN